MASTLLASMAPLFFTPPCRSCPHPWMAPLPPMAPTHSLSSEGHRCSWPQACTLTLSHGQLRTVAHLTCTCLSHFIQLMGLISLTYTSGCGLPCPGYTLIADESVAGELFSVLAAKVRRHSIERTFTITGLFHHAPKLLHKFLGHFLAS